MAMVARSADTHLPTSPSSTPSPASSPSGAALASASCSAALEMLPQSGTSSDLDSSSTTS